ncbi:MAG: DUF2070 family protein [Promethearchaeota archaeon]
MYDQYKISRKSPGIFALFSKFTRTQIIILLFLGAPFLIALGSYILYIFLNFIISRNIGALNLSNLSKLLITIFLRDYLIFSIILGTGVIACVIFANKVPLFNFKISALMNVYAVFFFALSYYLGQLLTFIYHNIAFLDIFFILGGLLAYIILFVIYFSFTTLETPLNIFVALVQPVFGIFIYAILYENLYWDFVIKSVLFFCTSALIFAIPYSKDMFSVSRIYRSKTGIGGYNFVRAFITSLLLDNQDDLVEKYFDDIGVNTELELKYLAFKSKDSKSKNKIKGVFLVPNIHFGPFKTAGSAAFTEEVYKRFTEIPGLSVMHTTTTHAENLTTHKYNPAIIKIIEEDLKKIKFKDLKATKFKRAFSGKTKILGALFGNSPIMFLTRHPFPTDDIVPSVGEKIKEKWRSIKMAQKDHNEAKEGDTTSESSGTNPEEIFIVDCHNAIKGDEILIKDGSEEANEMIDVSEKFFNEILQTYNRNKLYPVEYGVAHDPFEDIPVEWGIGKGGMTVHIFKIGDQTSALIHFDANNALLDVRPRIINLVENKGIDRAELTTSDSHTVARVLSAQGYYPLGGKVPIDVILNRLNSLIDSALKNLEPVQVGVYKSINGGFRKWGDLDYFNVILETIEKCVSKSKQLLTFGLFLPMFLSILLATFYFNVPINPIP